MSRPLAEGSTLGDNLIFVISQPRAGSTMLQKILAAHPAIHTMSEPWIALHPLFALREEGLAADFDPAVAGAAITEFLRKLPEGDEAYYEALRRMLQHLYSRALDLSNKSIFLDKTPRYYFIIPQLRRVFPRARFVFLLRNPLAVLVSTLETWCKENPAAELGNSRHDLMAAPNLLLSAIDAAGRDAIVTHYEDLVTQPAQAVRRLCDRLEIDFYPGMVEYGASGAGAEHWHYGDQGTVYREKAPAAERAERWRDVLKENPQWAAWAHGYLTALGSDIVCGLGYNYKDMCVEWHSPFDRDQWSALMRPPHEVVLDQARQEALSVAAELEAVELSLAEQTAELGRRNHELRSLATDLASTRRLLAERTAELDRCALDLQSRTDDLVHTRNLLAERTAELDRCAGDLQSRTEDLVDTRRVLVERTTELERYAQELQSRTEGFA